MCAQLGASTSILAGPPFPLAHDSRGLCPVACSRPVLILVHVFFKYENEEDGCLYVALLCSATTTCLQHVVESADQSQMMSQTISLFRLLRQPQQEQPGRYLSTLLDPQRAVLEGKRSFILNLARQRSFQGKALTQTLSLLT